MPVRIPHLSGRFGRRRSWRRWAAGLALLGIVTLVAVYLYLTNPQRLSRFASNLLEDMTGAEVVIDETRVGLDGRIYLRGLRLRVPGVEGEAGRLLEAEQVTIGHRITSLFRGRFDATSLVIYSPTLSLTQDVATDRYNYQLLRERARRGGPLPRVLPDLLLRRGVIEFAELEAGRYLPLGRIHVEGRLAQHADQPGAYSFSLRQMTEHRPDAQIRGRFNLRDLSVSAELDRFAFDSPYGAVLPRKLRTWWQRLQPTGSLPMFRIAYDPDPRIGLYAIIELRDLEMSLPYGETSELPDDPRPYPRMRGVSGTFSIVRDEITINDLRGSIEGIGYQIDGKIFGLDESAPFRFIVRTEPFEIGEQANLYSLPRAVENELRRFSPSGTFHAQATIERKRAGGPLHFDGRLTLQDVDAAYWRFDYPLKDLRGTIRFTHQSLDIEGLDGRGPHGGQVHIAGSIAPPGDGAAVHLEITCRDLPLDQYVLDAMEPEHRAVIEMLGDRQQQARLAELGLLDRPGDDAGPPFEVGGRLRHVQIVVDRSLGRDSPYVMNARIDLAGMNMLFRHWPYPLQLTRGSLHVGPGLVRVEDVAATGLRGGSGQMHGVIARDDATGKWLTDLAIDRATLPMDDLLLATIPAPHDYWLRQFHLSGTLGASARITADPATGSPTFAIDTTLRDARAHPFECGFIVTDLTGQARITPTQVDVGPIRGRRGASPLQWSGQIDWSDQPTRLTLRFSGEDLVIEPALLGLVPPELGQVQTLRELFDRYQPQGRFNGTFAYETGQASPAFHVSLEPEELSVLLNEVRVGLTQMSGSARVERDSIRLERVGGALPAGRVEASGLITMGDAAAAALTFEGEAQRLDEPTRALLPTPVRRTVEALSLDGPFRVPAARLLWRARPGPGDEAMVFEGKVQLQRAAADLGVPIRELEGDLYVHAVQEGRPDDAAPGQAWPRLDIRLDAARLRAADRLIQPLQLHLVTAADRPELLHIQRLRGACYGGALVAEGWIDLAQNGMYRINATLSEAALYPFQHPLDGAVGAAEAAEPASPDADPTEPPPLAPEMAVPDPAADRSRGVLTASLYVEATPGQVQSRRGRGAIDVRDASLYELPIALAALQIANLAIPQSNAFDRASTRFIVDGDTIRFDTLRFEAPSVEMTGRGVMKLSSRELDLELVSRNPRAPQLGAMSDLFNVVKDELITIRVGGTLDEPRARLKALTGTRRSVKRVFEDRAPSRPPDQRADGRDSTSGQ